MDSPLKALFLLGTLKDKDKEWSHTQVLCEVVAEILEREHDTSSEIIYLRDYKIEPGVTTKVDHDAWPGIVEQMFEADIIYFATPIWWGIHSSLIQRVFERLDELNDKLIETGESEFDGKTAGVVITGAEDGAEHIIGNVLNFASWNGFAIPPAPSVSWLGDASGDTREDFKKRLKESPTYKQAQTSALNHVHLARLLKQNPFPKR